MQIYLLHIDQILDRQEISKRISSWSEFIQQNILSHLQLKDLNATFWAKLLLKYKMSQNNFEWEWEDYKLGNKDRPYIENSPLQFNISHSGEYVALAMDEHPLGIDIERKRPVKIELFNRQFHPDEWQRIQNSKNIRDQFFTFWSIKEAAIKADGRGMEVLSTTHILNEQEVKIENDIWFYYSFDDLEAYSMTVCSQQKIDLKNIPVETISASELLLQI